MAIQTTHTFNGRSSLEEKTKDNISSGLQNKNTLKIGSRQLMTPDFFESNLDHFYQPPDKSKYYSFNRYNEPKMDNWSYSTIQMGSHRSSFPSENKYVRRSLNNKKYHKKDNTRSRDNSRPKPLDFDNQKYYDHVFPKRDGALYASNFYQPNSYDHAEL